jgi:hypothetical protein
MGSGGNGFRGKWVQGEIGFAGKDLKKSSGKNTRRGDGTFDIVPRTRGFVQFLQSLTADRSPLRGSNGNRFAAERWIRKERIGGAFY